MQQSKNESFEKLLEWDLRSSEEKEGGIRGLGVMELKKWLTNYAETSPYLSEDERITILTRVNGITKSSQSVELEDELRKTAQKLQFEATSTIEVDKSQKHKPLGLDNKRDILHNLREHDMSLQEISDNLVKLYGNNHNVSDVGRKAVEEQLKKKLEQLENHCHDFEHYDEKSSQKQVTEISEELTTANLSKIYELVEENCTTETGKEKLKNISKLIDKITDLNETEERDHEYVKSYSEEVKKDIEGLAEEYDKQLKKHFERGNVDSSAAQNELKEIVAECSKKVKNLEKAANKYGQQEETDVQKNLQRAHAEIFYMQIQNGDLCLKTLKALEVSSQEIADSLYIHCREGSTFITATKEFTDIRKVAKEEVDNITENFLDAKNLVNRIRMLIDDKEMILEACEIFKKIKTMHQAAYKDYLYNCLKSSLNILKRNKTSKNIVVFRGEDYLGEPKKYRNEKAITQLYNEITEITKTHRKINSRKITGRFALKLLEGMNLINEIASSHKEFDKFKFGASGQKLIVDCLNYCINEAMERKSFRKSILNSKILQIDKTTNLHLMTRLYKSEWWSKKNDDIINGFKELQAVILQ